MTKLLPLIPIGNIVFKSCLKINYQFTRSIMNKQKKIILFTLSSLFSISLMSCKIKGGDFKPASLAEAKEFVTQNYMNFQQGTPARLITFADGYCNENGFGTTWSKSNVLYDKDEGMSLLLEVTEDTSRIKASSGDPYISAEMRSSITFRYGFFGTYMKPSGVKGTASTFFLYSDSPHDEIDIEFLGKDTTKVQFNFFHNGVGGNEHWYNLGFDASEEYHHYGFYWGPNEICWYVDFVPVYRVTGNNGPSAKCRLICNHWAGSTKNPGIMAWMGKVTNDDCPSFSRYHDLEIADINGEKLKVVPLVKEYNVCPDSDQLETKPVILKTPSVYTVNEITSNAKFDISYQKEVLTKDYRAAQFSVADIAENKWVQFKIKNLSEDSSHPTLCRLTVDTVNNSGTAMNKFLSAWKNGVSSTSMQLKNSNLEAHYELAFGEEAIVTFRWSGAGANQLSMMFDCFGSCPTIDGHGQRDGHVEISEFKFGGVQDFVPVDDSGKVDELYTKNGEIDDPEEDQVAIPAGFTKLNNITLGSNASYQISETTEGTLVTYNQLADGYEQTGYYGSNIFSGAREIILVIKNNNAKEFQLQLKIKSSSGDSLVSAVEVLSDSSTGKLARWSSSTPGVPYLNISGGRTCQFKLTLTDDTKSIAYVASPGAALAGSFLIKGTYAKIA